MRPSGIYQSLIYFFLSRIWRWGWGGKEADLVTEGYEHWGGQRATVPMWLFCSGLTLSPRGEGHSGNPDSSLGWSTKSSAPGHTRMGLAGSLGPGLSNSLCLCVWRVWRNLSSLSCVATGPLRIARSEDGGRETQQGVAELGREPRCAGPCSRGVACQDSWAVFSFKGLGAFECLDPSGQSQ